MTKAEAMIADILLSVIKGGRTVMQLRRRRDDLLTAINAQGVKNVAMGLIEEAACIESALQRIECERVKYDRQKNN